MISVFMVEGHKPKSQKSTLLFCCCKLKIEWLWWRIFKYIQHPPFRPGTALLTEVARKQQLEGRGANKLNARTLLSRTMTQILFLLLWKVKPLGRRHNDESSWGKALKKGRNITDQSSFLIHNHCRGWIQHANLWIRKFSAFFKKVWKGNVDFWLLNLWSSKVKTLKQPLKFKKNE